MNKYKLVKIYPGSPALGTISSSRQCGTDKTMHYFSGVWFDPKAYPDYWEKVIEKDYEILSFICNQNFNNLKYGEIIYLQKNKQYRGGKDNSIKSHNGVEGVLKCIQWSIHSVKRLSDGEIFTIGDNVQYFVLNEWDKSSISKIIKFTIDKDYQDNKIVIFTDRNEIPWAYLSETVRKTLTPLFTTEDGVDIFEGDKYSYVNYLLRGFYNITSHSNHALKDSMKFFSTKEKAEEYILMNKPCLSINEINSVYKNTDFIKLKKLVQNKLNK